MLNRICRLCQNTALWHHPTVKKGENQKAYTYQYGLGHAALTEQRCAVKQILALAGSRPPCGGAMHQHWQTPSLSLIRASRRSSLTYAALFCR